MSILYESAHYQIGEIDGILVARDYQTHQTIASINARDAYDVARLNELDDMLGALREFVEEMRPKDPVDRTGPECPATYGMGAGRE